MNNSIAITGRVGKYIQSMRFPSGKNVLNFSVAVKDFNQTLWFDVQAWNDLADEYRELVSKGKDVTVTGRLTLKSYTAKDGTKVVRPVVILNSLEVVIRQSEAA